LEAWIAQARLCPGECLFPSRMTRSPHLSTRQYARIVKGWVALIGLESGGASNQAVGLVVAAPVVRLPSRRRTPCSS
jgi:hypothetical protein